MAKQKQPPNARCPERLVSRPAVSLTGGAGSVFWGSLH
jgi:hypothetical protein